MTWTRRRNRPKPPRPRRPRWRLILTAAARLFLAMTIILFFWMVGHPLPEPHALMLWIAEKWRWLRM